MSWAAFPAKGIIKACEGFLGDAREGTKERTAISKLLRLAKAADGAQCDVNVTADDFDLIAEYRDNG